MKSILLCLMLFIGSGEWMTDFNSAREKAGREHKTILLNFSGSDWCGPCIKMKREIFETEIFETYAADNLVLVRADFPRLKKNRLTESLRVHNEELAEKYNPQGEFPLTLLLDEHGKILHQWDGYNSFSPGSFVDTIKKITAR